mmetsp:Transcript_14812/g.59318  ORF Transcript_14812/g.59318 Transcript_14812/m.59318 type:complete len:220 (+) Transcript_14812:221-880(+)
MGDRHLVFVRRQVDVPPDRGGELVEALVGIFLEQRAIVLDGRRERVALDVAEVLVDRDLGDAVDSANAPRRVFPELVEEDLLQQFGVAQRLARGKGVEAAVDHPDVRHDERVPRAKVFRGEQAAAHPRGVVRLERARLQDRLGVATARRVIRVIADEPQERSQPLLDRRGRKALRWGSRCWGRSSKASSELAAETRRPRRDEVGRHRLRVGTATSSLLG